MPTPKKTPKKTSKVTAAQKERLKSLRSARAMLPPADEVAMVPFGRGYSVDASRMIALASPPAAPRRRTPFQEILDGAALEAVVNKRTGKVTFFVSHGKSIHGKKLTAAQVEKLRQDNKARSKAPMGWRDKIHLLKVYDYDDETVYRYVSYKDIDRLEFPDARQNAASPFYRAR